jgi:hypothetical protein
MKVSSEIQKTAAPRSDTGRSLPDGKDRKGDPDKYPAGWGKDAGMLHQAIGNQRVKHMFDSGRFQAMPAIARPNNVYERETDQVAEQVLRIQTPAIRMKPG